MKTVNIWYQTKQLEEHKINSFMRILAEKTGINCEGCKITNQAAHYEWPKNSVQKAILNSLMTILKTPKPLLDTQNYQPNILSTTDSYNQFRFARQIYQDLVSKLQTTLPQAKSSKPQATPPQVNMLSRLPLHQLLLVPNEGLEIQKFQAMQKEFQKIQTTQKEFQEIQTTQKEIQEIQVTQKEFQEIQATQKKFLQGDLFMNLSITFH
ncbi:13976_t:CDS:2, partial [Racocetra fulgida]